MLVKRKLCYFDLANEVYQMLPFVPAPLPIANKGRVTIIPWSLIFKINGGDVGVILIPIPATAGFVIDIVRVFAIGGEMMIENRFESNPINCCDTAPTE